MIDCWAYSNLTKIDHYKLPGHLLCTVAKSAFGSAVENETLIDNEAERLSQ